MMKSKGLKLTMVGLLLASISLPGYAAAAETGIRQDSKQEAARIVCISPSELELSNTLRMLWTQHVNWTWNYIVSAIGGSPGQKSILDRLLRNQQDLGDAIKPFYGNEAGNKYAELLREHILIAGKIVDAAKAGNQQEVAKQNKEWYRNGDDIVKFMVSVNPNWSVKELQPMWNRHLELVTDAVTGVLKGDWPAYIHTSDLGEAHMLMLADVMTRGIVQQFPKKFAGSAKGSR